MRLHRECRQCSNNLALEAHSNRMYCSESCQRAARRDRIRRGLRGDGRRYYSDPDIYARMAGYFVRRAVLNGDLPRLDGSVECTRCGAAADHYHHHDYWLPMDVRPVCASCNAALGTAKHAFKSGAETRPREAA